MDTILGILSGESYSGIRALADLSVCVKYTNRSRQDVGQMFRDVPRQVLPHGQNQCPEGMNFELLAKLHVNHSRGVGIHVCLHHGIENWLVL